jgi:hypothetical protein
LSDQFGGARLFAANRKAGGLNAGTMSLTTNLVTIHPYFKLQPDKKAEAEAIVKDFIARTQTEAACLFYEFTVNGDVVFCREGYEGAAGVLAHLENVGEPLGKMLQISELIRLEFHGQAAEIDALRGPLGHLNPDFFVLEAAAAR